MRGQCQLLDKNHQYFQLFHCQQTQSLLITLYVVFNGMRYKMLSGGKNHFVILNMRAC
jgi:hypothetical protein